jgi:hypothetical protein
MRSLAQGAAAKGWNFFIIGDVASPKDFRIDGARFISLDAQLGTGLRFATKCPLRHYARKNIGYLLAAQDNATVIVETDDDNIPTAAFFQERHRLQSASAAEKTGWTNIYRYFHDGTVWPRGFRLDQIKDAPPAFEELKARQVNCPIQQGLANDNPDVDAIYRLTMPLPLQFRGDRRVALGFGSWCPFNSQNTTWWPDAYPLLYLPAHCSFRMTDIWRSLVAQRIAWENGWHVLFHEPTVNQDRNSHDLMKDFLDEIPGYLNNHRIAEMLLELPLKPTLEAIPDNLRQSYQGLAKMGMVAVAELDLLEAWLEDLAAMR